MPDTRKGRLCQTLDTSGYSKFVCNVTTVVRIDNQPDAVNPDFRIESYFQEVEHGISDWDHFEITYSRVEAERKCRFRDPLDDHCEVVMLSQVHWSPVARGRSYDICTIVKAEGPMAVETPLSIRMGITCDDHGVLGNGYVWENEP